MERRVLRADDANVGGAKAETPLSIRKEATMAIVENFMLY